MIHGDRATRDDRGSGLVELVWLAVILLVPLVYVVLSVFPAQRGALATTSAARAAGRAYVLAPTDAAGLEQAAEAVRQAYADQGLPADGVTVEVSCTPTPHWCHRGGSVVTVVVASRVALPILPSFLGPRTPAIGLDASFVVPVGQYREAPDASARA